MIVNTYDKRTKCDVKKCINCVHHKSINQWDLVCACEEKFGKGKTSSWFGKSTTADRCEHYEAIGKEVSIKKRTGKKTGERKQRPTMIEKFKKDLEYKKELLEELETKNDPDDADFINTLRKDIIDSKKRIEKMENRERA